MQQYIRHVAESHAYHPGQCTCDLPPPEFSGDVAYRVLHPDEPTDIAIVYTYGSEQRMDHSNVLDRALSIAKWFRAHVLVWDLPGYGHSKGTTTETLANAYADLVLNVAIERGWKPYVWGWSLGSVPTCHLASTRLEVRGVVLESPIASALHVKAPFWPWHDFMGLDPLNNLKAADANGFFGKPVIITFRMQDELVHNNNAIMLAESLRARGNEHVLVRSYPPITDLESKNPNHRTLTRDEELLVPRSFFSKDVRSPAANRTPLVQ